MSPVFLEIAVVVLGVLLLFVEMFARGDKKIIAWLGILGLGVVFVLSFYAVLPPDASSGTGVTPSYHSFYSSDARAMFFKRFALLTTMVVLIMSVDYLGVVRKFTPGASAQGGLGEFLALPVFTCAGLMWMASAVDFVMIFVSLELVTISFYVLVSYTRRSAASLEAGVKYLVLGALSTGFFVYGITWVFGITGQTNLDRVAAFLSSYRGNPAPVLFSFVLLTIALGFKIAAVPFQIWVPDVYQGAPTPVAAFLSVGSKAAGFVVLIRVLTAFSAAPAIRAKMELILLLIAAATLLYGNLAALPQNNLKRLLAYSSIGHAGYLMVGVASGTNRGAGDAVAFYLAAYLPMTLLSFFVMIVVANYSAGDDIADFNGLSKRSPFLAFAMLMAMVSLAGLPFTAGFMGKFLIFQVAIEQKQYFLLAVGVLAVACGFYYYLRVVRAMYFQPVTVGPETIGAIPISLVTRGTIAVLIAAILVLGIYPAPMLGRTGTTTPVITPSSTSFSLPSGAQSLSPTFQ